ncbi:2402_t:CDS:2 [Acaulospora colombiana]|uniref:2402_t:CDS:1 n=1 Tax=Acaulospora colombiana TaxID=27376 RepID=A0ACA9KQP5_9GLOM|nr:2402_t:CDS:2 [Acaulospora colombiana]
MRDALQTADDTNQNLYDMLEVPDAETSFLSGSSTDDSRLRTLELGMEEALEPGQRQSRLLDEILAEGSENSSLGSQILPDFLIQDENEETQDLDTISPDSYTSDSNMTTIPELVDTIDGVNNDANILTILDRSLKGEAREWYHREFDNKNWELENVLDNSGIGANITAIRAANAGAITGAGVRSDIRDEIYRIGQTKPINDIIDSLAELELRHGILKQAPLQSRYEPISSAVPDVVVQSGPSNNEMQKSFQAMLEKQKAESKAELEKLKTEFETKMAQQSKKSRPPVPPKNYEEIHEHYASQGDPRPSLTNEETWQELIKMYGPPPIQPKPEKLRSSNQSARIDRLESVVGKVADSVGQLTNQFSKMSLDNQPKKPFYCSNCGQEGHRKNYCPELTSQQEPVAKSNFTHRYFPPLKPIQSQQSWQSQNISPDLDEYDSDESGYNEEENRWNAPEKKTTITNRSEFNAVNNAFGEALGWKPDLPFNFSYKGNSEHVDKSLEWHTDVPISLKDKEGKTVTVTGNFARIDNGEPDPMICLGMAWIRKAKCVPDVDKKIFSIEIHGKTYIIPTFRKPTEISRPSSFHAITVQDNDTDKQTSNSSTKTDTKEKSTLNKEIESQVSDLSTEELKKKS